MTTALVVHPVGTLPSFLRHGPLSMFPIGPQFRTECTAWPGLPHKDSAPRDPVLAINSPRKLLVGSNSMGRCLLFFISSFAFTLPVRWLYLPFCAQEITLSFRSEAGRQNQLPLILRKLPNDLDH